jgi:hypothetical protein
MMMMMLAKHQKQNVVGAKDFHEPVSSMTYLYNMMQYLSKRAKNHIYREPPLADLAFTIQLPT